MAFIIVPIRYGYIETGKFAGWIAVRCSYCKTVQPTACYDISRQNTLYDLKVTRARAISKRLVCSFCNESVDISQEIPVKLNQTWHTRQSIQELVNSTNPALGLIDKGKNRSADEIKAILNRVEEWTDHAFHNESQPIITIILFTIISFVFGSLIGGYLPQVDGIDNFIIVYGVSFAVIGCIIGYFAAKYYFVRQNLLEILAQAGKDKGIGKDEFIRVLTTMPKKKKQLTWAVRNLS